MGAKVIDGEAIILNVATGRYHSIDGAGAAAWEMIDAGHSLDEIADALTGRYEIDSDQALVEVQRLARELLDQELVLVDGRREQPGPVPASVGARRRPYEPLELVTFTDIEELLALDPPLPLIGQDAWTEDDRSQE